MSDSIAVRKAKEKGSQKMRPKRGLERTRVGAEDNLTGSSFSCENKPRFHLLRASLLLETDGRTDRRTRKIFPFQREKREQFC